MFHIIGNGLIADKLCQRTFCRSVVSTFFDKTVDCHK